MQASPEHISGGFCRYFNSKLRNNQLGLNSHKKENLRRFEVESLDFSIFYFLQIAILFEYKVSSEPIDLNHLRAKIRLSRSLYLNPRSPVTLLSSLHTQTEIFFKRKYFQIKIPTGLKDSYL